MNVPVKVILHCSDTPDFKEGSPNQDQYDIFDIDIWHKERGFNSVGYHFVITRGGKVQVGRALDVIGAHVKGHNEDSIAICWMGRSRPTKAQLDAIIKLYYKLKVKFGIKYPDWHGHYEYNQDKSCPGISMVVIRKLLEMVDDTDCKYIVYN